MATERLGELRRLAVADGSGDAGYRQRPGAQQLGRVRHAHTLELVAEARSLLGEDALELAAGGRDRVGDGRPARGSYRRNRALSRP